MNGAHVLLCSRDAGADRAFVRDVLGFPYIDVGGGWSIFAPPPAEMAVHPVERELAQDHGGERLLGALRYLMCDDVRAEAARLAAQGVACSKISQESWGSGRRCAC